MKVIQELGALVQVLAAHDSGVVVVRVAGKQVDRGAQWLLVRLIVLLKELQLMRLRAHGPDCGSQGTSQWSIHWCACNRPSNDRVVNVILIGEVDGIMTQLPIIIATLRVLMGPSLSQTLRTLTLLTLAG